MKKILAIALSCILVMSLSGPAMAKNDKANKADAKVAEQQAKEREKSEKEIEKQQEEKDKQIEKEKEEREKELEKQAKEKKKQENKNRKNEEQQGKPTVTEDTYGIDGRQGYKGLLRAIENVKDKPAGAVVAEILLTKYDSQLTEEAKAKLEAIIEADAALSEAASLLDQQGSVTDAVYVQKEAIRANKKNLDAYKKLGKYYEKLGKHGMKLFVNGEEQTLETDPVVQNGSSLIPFRTIAEALQAEVVWNQKSHTITVMKDDITIVLQIGGKKAYVNGVEKSLDAPAQIIQNTTLVPARFVSESLGAEVVWEPEFQTVVVYEDEAAE
ncbi:copper amine oxidase N-terminal domain-containing protein [Paenibacillus sp. M1]|uniref:Copper amine oxidase N-terminal domain-containing protein n=1 Tax=Paenibacillus haidiansis TaxID=1574488 RepID=A0ABU7VXJ9_9BACL